VLIFMRVDRHRQCHFPKGYNGCAARRPCAEEFVAGRYELLGELMHVV
jgi:hypothetical protein